MPTKKRRAGRRIRRRSSDWILLLSLAIALALVAFAIRP